MVLQQTFNTNTYTENIDILVHDTLSWVDLFNCRVALNNQTRSVSFYFNGS
jgi:hypothetical protein